jgi:SAM-dependent methyltransferase
MVALARHRLGSRADILEADITQPLRFADETFDLVICPLVLGYVRDLRPVYQEFFRVLRRPGYFVFSAGHPFFDFFYYKSEHYFDTEQVGSVWMGFGKPVFIPGIRRPLGAIVNPLLDVGFVLERILEPLPTDEFKAADPEGYEKLQRFPGFICFRARKGEAYAA